MKQTWLLERLKDLSDQWEARARRKFRAADGERDVAGKRLIEHGATCYFNCSEDLRKLLGALRSSPIQPGRKARTKRPV